jgi:hypothetical protein
MPYRRRAADRFPFASEAPDTRPRELAGISLVLGHDSTGTTLRFYLHRSASAGQRIGATTLDDPARPDGDVVTL